MRIQTRRAGRTRPIPEVLFVFLVGLLLLGDVIRRHPYVMDARSEATATAPLVEERSVGDVLVVLPDVAPAMTLDAMSFDQTWLNAVEQEIGVARTLSAARFDRPALNGIAWLIVPRKAAAQFNPTQVQIVREWLQDGGVAILEQPEGPWRGLTGQSFSGVRARDSRRITAFDATPSRGELRNDLTQMPLRTGVLPWNPPNLSRGRDYEVAMEIDGLPAVVSMNVGSGKLLLVLFDLGRAVGTMQQGRPRPDFRVDATPDAIRAPGVVPSSSLVADPSLRVATVPFADLLERNLLYLADAHRPVGRLWLFPADRRGALLATHSEAGFGPRARFMPEWEHENGQRSTLFVVAHSLSPELLARHGRTGSDIQLQWVPGLLPGAPVERFGLGNFRPVRRAMNFAAQREQLQQDAIPYGPPIANRTLHGLWTSDWLEAFRILDAAGVRLDVSLGPGIGIQTEQPPEFGYLFGTGYPFHPIDTNGNRFRVRALPTTVDDAAPGYDLTKLRRLLVESSDRYHTAIVADWHADTMVLRPSFDSLEGWRRSFELARSQDLWVTTLGAFSDFLDRRAASRVQSTWNPDDRQLAIEAQVVGPRSGDDDAVALTPSVSFPARVDGKPVARVVLDGAVIDVASLALTGDRVLHLLPLEPGEHRIEIIWAAPTELPREDQPVSPPPR